MPSDSKGLQRAAAQSPRIGGSVAVATIKFSRSSRNVIPSPRFNLAVAGGGRSREPCQTQRAARNHWGHLLSCGQIDGSCSGVPFSGDTGGAA